MGRINMKRRYIEKDIHIIGEDINGIILKSPNILLRKLNIAYKYSIYIHKQGAFGYYDKTYTSKNVYVD